MKKNNALQNPSARALRLEALESRELLSVAPVEAYAVNVEISASNPLDEAIDLSSAELEVAAASSETPSTIVNSLADVVDDRDGVITLREAVNKYYTSGSSITFDESLEGGTIVLSNGPIELGSAITIDASAVSGLTIDANNQSCIFTVATGGSLMVKGLTLINGYGDKGGAIFGAAFSNITIEDSVFHDNSAETAGAVYSAISSNLVVKNSTFFNNKASSSGGAIYAESNVSVSIEDSCLYDNVANANNNGEGDGGAVYASNVTEELLNVSNTDFYRNRAYRGGALYLVDAFFQINIENSNFYQNCASYGGGAIFASSSTLYLKESNLYENSADGYGSHGGAIYQEYGTLVVTNSSLYNNESVAKGGAFYAIDGYEAAFAETTFYNNTSARGGAVYSELTDFKMQQTSLHHNSAEAGGAIFADVSAVDLNNVLIHSNEASENGAAIYSYEMAITLANVTIVNNNFVDASNVSALNVGAIYLCGSSWAELYNSIVVGNASRDFATFPATSNPIYPYHVVSNFTEWSGGRNCSYFEYQAGQPLFNNPEENDYTLAPASQAIDLGDNRFVPGYDKTFDLSSRDRIQNETVDLGAYEYSPSTEENNGVFFFHDNTSSAQTFVNWDAIQNAASYSLSLSENNGLVWNVYESGISGTSLAVSGLEMGKTYQILVRGFSSEGTLLNSYRQRTFAPVSLSAISASYHAGETINVALTAANPDNVTIQWYYGDEEILEAKNSLSYAPTESEYDIKIVATGKNDSTGSVSTVTVARPATVGTVSVSNYNATTAQATLAWTPIANAACYSLQISEDSGETWRAYDVDFDKNYGSVGGLLAGKSYQFRTYGFTKNGDQFDAYNAGSFAPISLETAAPSYTDGETVSVVLHAADESSVDVKWYYVDPLGATTEIPIRGSQFKHTPTSSTNDIVVVATGTGDSEGSVSRVVIPYAPTLGQIVFSNYNAASHKALLTWSEIISATSYTIQISSDNGLNWYDYSKNVNVPTAEVIGLYIGKSYSFRILGVDNDGKTIGVHKGVFAPVGLATDNKEQVYTLDSAIEVNPTGAENIDADVRWYYVAPCGDVEITTARGKLSYLPAIALYDVKVVATGEEESTGSSSELTFQSGMGLGAVNVVDYDPVDSRATVSWEAIPGAQSYTIKKSTDGGVTWSTYASGITGLSKTVNNLYVGKSHILRVYGVSGAGATLESFNEGVFSPISFESSVDVYTAGVPINLTLTGGVFATCDYHWYYITQDGDVEIEEASCVSVYAPEEDSYDIKIVAVGTDASAGSSSTRVVKSTVSVGKVTLDSYDPLTQEALLNWNKIPRASTYSLQYSNDEGTTWKEYASDLVVTSASVDKLTAGNTYQFRVSALSVNQSPLGSYDEGIFSPVKLTSESSSYVSGETIRVSIHGEASIRWYEIVNDVDVEIEEAAGLEEYAPSEDRNDIKVVATGVGNSANSTFELIVRRAPLRFHYDESSQTLRLSWEAINGATSYVVRQSKDDGASWSDVLSDVTQTTASVGNIQANEFYTFRVYGRKSSGDLTSVYREADFTPVKLTSSSESYRLDVPIVVSLNSTTADVRWYYMTDHGDVEIEGTESLLSYTPVDAPYDIRVVATGTGDSEGSNAEIIISKPEAVVGTISIASYSPSTNQALLRWDAIADASTYTLQISEDGGASWSVFSKNFTNNYKAVKNLYPGQSYLFRVLGVNSTGSTLSSYNERVFAPISLTASVDSYSTGETVSITLNASDNASADVRWFYVTDAGQVEITEANGLLSYTPLENAYDLKVVATGAGDSQGANAEIVVSKPEIVVGTIAIANYSSSTNQALLRWDAIADASTYTLQISGDGGVSWSVFSKNFTNNYKTVKNIYPGQSYLFRVYGINSGGIALGPYNERAFAPISLTASDDSYSAGQTIFVTLNAANEASADIRWFYVTESGDVEINEARGRLSYAPDSSQYEIRVVAEGTADSLGSSATLTLKPSAPASLGSVTVVRYTYTSDVHQALVKWPTYAGAEYYKLDYSTDGGETWLVYAKNFKNNYKGVNCVYPSKSYDFRVMPLDSAKQPMCSSYYEGTLAPLALLSSANNYTVGVPITLTKLATANASSTIKWYKLTGGGDVEIVSARNQLSYTPESADYDIKVVSTGTGVSLKSNYELTIAADCLIAPTFDYDSSTRKALLSWNAIDGATSYLVKISKDGGFTWTTYKSGLSSPEVTVNGLYVGKTYGFRITGLSDSGTTLSTYQTIFKPTVSTSAAMLMENLPYPIVQAAASESDVSGKSLENLATDVVPSGSVSVTNYDHVVSQATVAWDAIPGAADYSLLTSVNGGLTWEERSFGLTNCEDVITVNYDRSSKIRVYGYDAEGTRVASYIEGTIAPFKLIANRNTFGAGDSLGIALSGPVGASATYRWYNVTLDGDEEIAAFRNYTSYTPSDSSCDVKVVATGTGSSEGVSYTCLFCHLTEEAASTVVTSASDVVNEYDGVVTLREALEKYSVDGDVITFDESLQGATITLYNGQLELNKSLSIDASSLYDVENDAPGLTIRGSGSSRIFNVIASSVALNGLKLTNGFSAQQGGAVYAYRSTLSISNSVLCENNSADNGGAIFASRSTVSVDNTRFENNAASVNGGAIYAYNSPFTIGNSEFRGNEAAERGGAINALASSPLAIVSSSFSENVAGLGGGAISAQYGSDVDIDSSKIYENNVGSGLGGALYLLNADVTLENSLIYGNASTTGTLDACYSEIVLKNDTIVNHNSSALYLREGVDVSVYNTILADNAGGDVVKSESFDGSVSAFNTLASYSEWSNIDATNYIYDSSSPLFTDAANGDYTLNVASQAIDRGDNDYVESARDLAGNSRVISGTVDLGAYESDQSRLYFADYDATTGQVMVSWNAISNANSYSIEISGDGGQTWETRASGITTPSTSVSGLSVLNSYLLRVYGADANGETLDSYREGTFAPFSLDASVLEFTVGVPFSISLIGADSASADLRWYYVTDAGDVEIFGARGMTSYAPSESLYDVKIVGAGKYDSTGCSAEVIVPPVITEKRSTIVTSVEDVVNPRDGVVTLREAIEVYAKAGEVVTFDRSLKGKTIVLAGSQFEIAKSITIDASSLYDSTNKVPGLTIDAGSVSRAFMITGANVKAEINSLIFTNGNEDKGGAVFVNGSTTTIKNSLFRQNTATQGGAVYVENSTQFTVDNSTFDDNVANLSGGALYGYNSSVQIVTTQACANSASTGSGGAFFLENADFSFVNSLAYDNKSSTGSVIDVISGDVVISNATVAGNAATSSNGGAVNIKSGSAYVSNSIIIDNEGGEIVQDNSAVYGYYTLSTYTNWANVDPTQYVYSAELPLFTDEENNDYSLAANSQAIGRGFNDYIDTELVHDALGGTRVSNKTVDIGACEYQILEAASTKVDVLRDVVDPYDGYISLREALTAYAYNGGVVTFDDSLKGGTIAINGSPIVVSKSVVVDASSIFDAISQQPGITLDASNNSSILEINSASVEINGLAFANGYYYRRDSHGARYGSGAAVSVQGQDEVFAELKVANSAFFGNYAYYGGGVYAQHSILTVENSLFDHNSGSNGAAIYATGESEVLIENSIFRENKSEAEAAVSISNSSNAIVRHSDFCGNYGTWGSAFNVGYRSTAVVEASAFHHHTGADGALRVDGASLEVNNSLVYDNRCSYSGGIFAGGNYSQESFELTIRNTTITDNSSGLEAGYAGAVYLRDSGVVNIYNSIVVNNTGGDINKLSDFSGDVNAYNVLSSYEDWSNSSPVAYNYDSAQELFADAEHDDYTLTENSQAVNKGDNQYVSGKYDMAGRIRILDAVDLGAYEYGSSSVHVYDYDSATGNVSTSWEPVNGAVAYEVRYGVPSEEPTIKRVEATNATLCVQAGETYAIRVYAVNASGSTFSNVQETTFSPIAVSTSQESYIVGETVSVTLSASEEVSPDIRWYWITENGDVEIADAAGSLSYVATDDQFDIRIVASLSDNSEGNASEVVVVAPIETIEADYDARTLSWRPLNDASSYIVRVSEDNGATWTDYALNVLQTQTDVSALAAGKSYLFRVFGVTSSGAFLTTVQKTTYAPIGVSVSQTSYTAGDEISIELTTPESSSASVRWYYVTESDVVEIREARGLLSYTPLDDRYDVKLVVVGTGNSSGFVSEALVVAPVCVEYDGSVGEASLFWSPVDNAQSYTIEVWQNDSITQTIVDVTQSSLTVVGIDAGYAYKFRVYSVDSNGTNLPIVKEAVFVPIMLTSNLESYVAGDTISVALVASQDVTAEIKWFEVTPSGNVEIQEASGLAQYTFEAARYDVYIEATGTGAAKGSVASVVVSRPLVTETPSTIVTSLDDFIDEYDGLVTLREALDVYANEGDTIVFDRSLKGKTIFLNEGEFNIAKTVSIDASDLYDSSSKKPGLTIDAGANSRIFNITSGTVEISGLAITNGKYVSASNTTGGSAISVSGTSTELSVRNSEIYGNNSSYGTIFAQWASLSVENSTFFQNTAREGGVIYAYNATTTINDSLFFDNHAVLSGGVFEVFGIGSSITIQDTTCYNNRTNGDGAVVYAWSDSEVAIKNSVFFENHAAMFGGVISIDSDSTLTVEYSSFHDNDSYQGGVVYSQNSDALFHNSLLCGNNARGAGSAVYACSDSELALYNATISNNSSGSRQGALCFSDSASANVYNSIVAGNSGADVYSYESSTTLNAYRVLSSYTGWTNRESNLFYEHDPLTPLFNLPDVGDYSLVVGSNSQAIDRGDNSYVYYNYDLTGAPRIFNTVDLGAYESTRISAVCDAISGDLTLSWNAIDNAVSYVLKVSVNNEDEWTEYATANLSTVLADVEAGTLYQFRVYGIDSFGSVLDNFYETSFTPFDFSVSASEYTLGDTLRCVLNGDADVRWYYVEDGRDVEIEDAYNALEFTPSSDLCDLHIVAHGAGESYGYVVKAHVATTHEKPSCVVNSTEDVVDASDGLITLREAILYAQEGDTITFDSSLQGKTITLNGTQIEITKSLAIDASSLYSYSENKPGLTIDANGQSRIFEVSSGTVEINSLALVNGYHHVTNSDGTTTGFGAAIYCSRGSFSKVVNLTVKNAELCQNDSCFGAAIYVSDGSLTVDNSSFHHNTGDNGGAIYAVHKAQITVNNSHFYENSAKSEGGAVYLNTVVGCVVANSTFNGNSSNEEGGAFYLFNDSQTTIKNSLFYENTCQYRGSAIYSRWSQSKKLFNTTIVDNVSAQNMGAIYVDGQKQLYPDDVTLYNSIVLNNAGGDVYLPGAYGTINAYNVLSGYTDWSNDDVVAFVHNSSQPLFADADNDDYTLAANSQAINKGSNTYVDASMTTDLAGNDRIQNKAVDLGAYEAPSSANNSSTTSILDEVFAEFFEEGPFDDEC